MATKEKNTYIKNIYYMLAYAFMAPHQSYYEDVATEEFDGAQDLFAAILAKGIGLQLKRGLYREYRTLTEDLPVVRGRIEMRGTIRNRMARHQRMSCEYDELTENNLLNQILKTAVMLLLRHGNVEEDHKAERKEDRKVDRRAELRKEMLFFSGVDEIDLRTIRWSSVRIGRNNRDYLLLIGVCQLLIQGMLQTTEDGTHRLARIIDDQRIERLYEKFLLEFYRKEIRENSRYKGVQVGAEHINWALPSAESQGLLPKMQSDVMLSYGNKVLIIDAKFNGQILQSYHERRSIRSGHMYQIFAYVKNKDEDERFGDEPHEVSGMLLYAATDEAILPDESHRISGNWIGARTLDLNREFSEIKSDLRGILDRFLQGDLYEDIEVSTATTSQTREGSGEY